LGSTLSSSSPTTFAPASTRTRKGERTAERILDVAEELFAERGYAGTTLRDVAGRVGLRNPSLYNHFPNKESLYAAVLRRGIGPVLETLGEFVDTGSDAYRDSGQVVERIMDLLARHPNLPRLVQHETLAGGQRLTPILRDWIGPTFARAREIVEAGPASRHWEPDQIPLLVLAMYQIVVGYFTIAPLYAQIDGENLLTRQALARQTRFLTEVVNRLFSEQESK
jgi:AcrR family transcriptional regulator